MRRSKVVLASLLVLLATGGILGGVALLGVIRNVNRPAPATYPIARAERMARAAGIRAKVDRLLFIDLDVNAGIFIAHDVKLDATRIENGEYREGSGRWGEVRVLSRTDGRMFVAFCAATTRGEWLQARRWFGDEVGRAIR